LTPLSTPANTFAGGERHSPMPSAATLVAHPACAKAAQPVRHAPRLLVSGSSPAKCPSHTTTGRVSNTECTLPHTQPAWRSPPKCSPRTCIGGSWFGTARSLCSAPFQLQTVGWETTSHSATLTSTALCPHLRTSKSHTPASDPDRPIHLGGRRGMGMLATALVKCCASGPATGTSPLSNSRTCWNGQKSAQASHRRREGGGQGNRWETAFVHPPLSFSGASSICFLESRVSKLRVSTRC